MPGIWGKGEVKFDIFNFANLLNKKWGEVYDIDFPYNRTLANFAGIDQATGKYVYKLPTERTATSRRAPSSSKTSSHNRAGRCRSLCVTNSEYPQHLKNQAGVRKGAGFFMSMDGRYAGNAGAISGDVHGWTVCRPAGAPGTCGHFPHPCGSECRSNFRPYGKLCG